MSRRSSAVLSVRGLEGENAALRENVDLKHRLLNSERRNSLVSLMVGLGANPSNVTSWQPLSDNSVVPLITIGGWIILAHMYKMHGILQSAIDVPILDALRGGIEIESEQMGDDVEVLQDAMEEDAVLEKAVDAMIWRDLFGGSGLILNTEQDPRTPLNEAKLKGRKLDFIAASRWELGAMERVAQSYLYYGKTVDGTRVMTMAGKTAPYPMNIQLLGWGLSRVEAMVEDFNKFLKTNQVVYELLEEAKIDVYGIDGLNQSVISEDGTNYIRRKVEVANSIKNFQKALVIDKEDTYEQKQISSFDGLANVLTQSRIGICASFRMPFSKLWGTTAGGASLANSGQDDLENYNARIESEVRGPMKPLLRRIINLKCAQLFGKSDFKYKLRFKPLRVLGAVEEESIKTAKVARIRQLFDMGIVREKVGEMAISEGVVDEEFVEKTIEIDQDLNGDEKDEGEAA